MTMLVALPEKAPYWTRKTEDERIVTEALRILWLTRDPHYVAAFIETRAAA